MRSAEAVKTNLDYLDPPDNGDYAHLLALQVELLLDIRALALEKRDLMFARADEEEEPELPEIILGHKDPGYLPDQRHG